MRAPLVYQWQPTTAQIAERAGIAPERVVRFDQNTSPGAQPWVAAAASEHAGSLNEYPGADYHELRRAIADHHGLADPRQVVVGAGADEMILLIARAWLAPDRTAVADTPTYSLYRIATWQQGARFLEVRRPLPSLEFPLEEFVAAAGGTSITWLCVPHNPVGDVLDGAAIARLARAGGTTVIDAAYAEFAGVSHADLLATGDDIIVLGTLSKAFGLAGIRVGYALASEANASRLDAVRPPGSISTLSEHLGRRALRDAAWMRANVALIVAERGSLAEGLERLGLEIRPSNTNFLLCRIGKRAHELADRLMGEFGLVLRTFDAEHALADHVRITVRDPESHDRLIDALERVL